MLQLIINEKCLTAKAVIGIYPANANEEDDIEVYEEHSLQKVKFVLHTLRQQTRKTEGQPNIALSDFIIPKSKVKDQKSTTDFIGAFALSTGFGIEKWIEKFEKDHDDYSSIMIKALADRLAEGFAELLHKRVRTEFWGYSKEENLSTDELIKENYEGIRPAPGYPAQPDHTEKLTIWELLGVEKNIGIVLTESLAMYPTAAVTGLYFANPESHYFGLGKISKDQVIDYARRKNMKVEEVEKWLGQSLAHIF
jgi:5-methyltetrahydrofolate--homocysteine methyltransferase